MKRLLKAGLMWKIGLPAALIALVVVGVAFLPIFLISGIGGSSDSETGTGTPVGTGISDAVPEEYRAMILRAGTICEDVTPDIIAAQIEAESNWNPNAVSPVGAAGLTQFMPATWTSHGKDGDGDGRADITNPADAIWSQGNYMCLLRGLVTGYVENGQASGTVIDLTLAAYNAGQGNVLAYGGVPPFSETQNYVKKILELAAGKYSAGPVYTGAGSSAIVDAAISVSLIAVRDLAVLTAASSCGMRSRMRLVSNSTCIRRAIRTLSLSASGLSRTCLASMAQYKCQQPWIRSNREICYSTRPRTPLTR